MKIRFNIDRNVVAQDVVVQEFKAGQVYELSHSSARRWIKRGLATEVIDRKPIKAAAKAKTVKATIAEVPVGKAGEESAEAKTDSNKSNPLEADTEKASR